MHPAEQVLTRPSAALRAHALASRRGGSPATPTRRSRWRRSSASERAWSATAGGDRAGLPRRPRTATCWRRSTRTRPSTPTSCVRSPRSRRTPMRTRSAAALALRDLLKFEFFFAAREPFEAELARRAGRPRSLAPLRGPPRAAADRRGLPASIADLLAATPEAASAERRGARGAPGSASPASGCCRAASALPDADLHRAAGQRPTSSRTTAACCERGAGRRPRRALARRGRSPCASASTTLGARA